MAKRIAFLNNKGGVGKSFCAVALAEAAARRGWRVLVVDMDPQANATRRLGVHPEPWGTLTNCLQMGLAQGAAGQYITGHGWDDALHPLQIDVLAADLDLEDRALEAGQPGAHYRLRRALFGADEANYHLTIIDCPPSIKGPLATMAIAALNGPEDTVIVPLETEADAVVSARRTVDYVQGYREDLSVPELSVAGVIVNKSRPTTVLHQSRRGDVEKMLADLPVLAEVTLQTRLAEAQDAGRPLGSDVTLQPVLAQFDRLAWFLSGKEQHDGAYTPATS